MVIDAFSSKTIDERRRWELPQGIQADSVVALVHDLHERLSGLAEEFGRRAAEVAERQPPAASSNDPSPETVLVARARKVMEHRRVRSRFLPAELFHEPAWDMLLALYIAQHDGRTMNVKTLVSYAEAPATTSQRWIDHLHKLGLIDRVTDMVDRRRVEVQLSETGLSAIRRYLDATA